MNTQHEAAAAASGTCVPRTAYNAARRSRRRKERSLAFAQISRRSPDQSYSPPRSVREEVEPWIAKLRSDVRVTVMRFVIFLLQQHGGPDVLGRTFALDRYAMSRIEALALSPKNIETCISKCLEYGFVERLAISGPDHVWIDGKKRKLPIRYRLGHIVRSRLASRHDQILRAKKRAGCSFASVRYREVEDKKKKKEHLSVRMHPAQIVAQVTFKRRATTPPRPVSRQQLRIIADRSAKAQGSPLAAIAEVAAVVMTGRDHMRSVRLLEAREAKLRRDRARANELAPFDEPLPGEITAEMMAGIADAPKRDGRF